MSSRVLPPTRSYAPNLAPMVDVTMVILIFFMLGARLVVEEGALPTELPSQVGPGGGSSITIIPTVRITLIETAQGGCQIFLMGSEIPGASFTTLQSILKQRIDEGANAEGRVLIEAGPDVEYQYVVSAMDACVGSGFQNIRFAVSGISGQGSP